MVAVKFSFRKCHRYIHLISSLCSLSVHGGWGPWGAWSACTKTCGSGTQIQERRCDSPRPDHGGRPCEGPGQQSQACNTRNCPGMDNEMIFEKATMSHPHSDLMFPSLIKVAVLLT